MLWQVLNIESLFTNIPLKETIDLCVDILFSNTTNIDGITSIPKLYLNCQHTNIKFISEIKENNSISFHGIKINRDNNRFLTSVYRKPTFSGVFTNFDSYISLSYKPGLMSSLLYRAFKCDLILKFFIKNLSF